MSPEQSKPIRLLIADDEEDLVTFLSHRLRKRGLDVTTALSGAEAVSAAARFKFDVAVVDLRMPDMDGIQVIEQIKGQQPHVEVIMLTGHGGHDSAWEAGRLNAFRYILKPYDFEDLSTLIYEAAQHRREIMRLEFEAKLDTLMTGTTSPREIIEESENLRREYEQD